MKNYFCHTCGIGFKTLKAKKHHESIPIRKIYDYSFILSTNKKYFLFTDAKKITRKHDELYEILTQFEDDYFASGRAGLYISVFAACHISESDDIPF